MHKLRLFLLFGLRRVGLSSFRAVTIGCGKRFLCPEAVYRYREWAKKRLKEQKQTMIKAATYARKRELRLFLLFGLRRVWLSFSRAVTVECRKRFLCPEAVCRYREWAKKRLKEQKSTITKAATYAQKRELRFSFCSLVCAECDNPTYFAGTVCQMFFAYSFTALSAANLPEQAVFIRDIEFQRFLSAQSSSILFCAWR